MDHEAEAEVVHGQILEVPGEDATGAQAPAERTDDPDAVAIVADEGDETVPFRTGRRLADVMQESAEAQRRAATHLVSERLVEQSP
jgi:hypothetical protein